MSRKEKVWSGGNSRQEHAFERGTGGRFQPAAAPFSTGRVNCTRLFRGLIVPLFFRQAFEVLHGLQGFEIPVYYALHPQRVNGSCDCDSGALLAGSAQFLVGVFQFLPQLNCHP